MRQFLDRLRDQSALRIIRRAVDPRFELAAVTRASQQRDDAAILFENVSGSSMPVVSNLYGSRQRLCALIGAEGDRFCRHWTTLVNDVPRHADDIYRLSDAPADLGRAQLHELPQIVYFGKDAGPYLTAAVFLAREPESGVANLSFHRAMMVSDKELRVRLGSSHDLYSYQRRAEAKGDALEVALLIGAPPPVFLAACASIPYDADEIAVAAALNGAPIEMRPCATVDLMVPRDTEIVIEGRILPGERRPEGPFGEFMGYYVPVEDNHVLEVSAVSVREGALFHSLLCGSPEDLTALELAIATRVFGHLDATLPGIVDVACRPALMNTVVKIAKQYEGHPRQVMLGAFAAHADYSKTCMVVDEDVDIHDIADVWWAYLTRGRADRRALIIPDIPGFYRDPMRDHWGRLGIDATRPLGREAEFERKSIPGQDTIRLDDYL
jgi:UbiD family decarboxylase